MKSRNKSMIKCKFCDWQIPKFKTTKKGKRVHLYSALEMHVMINHEEEYKRIQDELGVE